MVASASSMNLFTMQDANDFCDKNVVAGETVRCNVDGSAVVFCRDRVALNYQLCKAANSCTKRYYLPDTCNTDSQLFVFRDAIARTEGHFRWAPKNMFVDFFPFDFVHELIFFIP